MGRSVASLLISLLMVCLNLSCANSEEESRLRAMTQERLHKYQLLRSRLQEAKATFESLAGEMGSVEGRLWDASSLCQGRLTTESGVAVSTSDRAAQSTVYFTPYKGSGCSLYNGTSWKAYSLTEISLTLSSLTSDKNYDVFLYDNSGTLTLELSAAWSSNTARTDALTVQDGIYVKSGATTRRYLGTLRTTTTSTTEDSAAKRFLWNMQNRLSRVLHKTDASAGWTYSTATWRMGNNSSANRVEFVLGMINAHVSLLVQVTASATGGTAFGVGLDIDGTATNDAVIWGGSAAGGRQIQALYEEYPGVGYHYAQWMEKGEASGSNFLCGSICGILGKLDG